MESKICEKCQNKMVFTQCCCSEKSMGYESKWICSICNLTQYNKKDANTNN